MDSVKVKDLVTCVSQYLMRELHEVFKHNKPRLIEYCSKTRSLLKRVKKVVSWAKSATLTLSKEQELDNYLNDRRQIQKTIASLLESLKNQQAFSLRTAPFAVSEAADVLCREGYYGFPTLGMLNKKKKIPLKKFDRIIKHKALLLDYPLGAEVQINNGVLTVSRTEYWFKFTLTPELKWQLVRNFWLKNQDLTPGQAEAILAEISENVNKSENSQILIVADSILKKTGLCALLKGFHKQSKLLKEISVIYNDTYSMQINYWPGFPSFILLKVAEYGIEITHSPIPLYIPFTPDLSEIVFEAINQHKKYRLNQIAEFNEEINRVTLNIRGLNCVEIDIGYFSGDFLVFVMGKLDQDLSMKIKTEEKSTFFQILDDKVLLSQVQSICRGFQKQLVQEPLRFSRSLYSHSEPTKSQEILGYIDLGTVLPLDSMGNLLIFALRFFKNPLSAELVGFNETKEEYNIFISSADNMPLDIFVKNSIAHAKDRMLILRIPITLLARPEI